LPPAVQHTIRAETGSEDIEDILKDTNSIPPIYRVFFVNRAAFPPLYIRTDGSLLNPDLSVAIGAGQDRFGILTGGPSVGVSLNDLPPTVLTVVQNQAPDAEIDTITKETRGDQTFYTVSFKGRRHADLVVASDGTIVPDTRIEVPVHQLNPKPSTGK